jgi:hypothetical protein
MVSPEDKHRDIKRTKEDKKRTHHIQPVLQLHSHVLHPPQPRPASSTATSCLLHSPPGSTTPTYLGLTHLTSTSQRHWTPLPVHKRHLDISTSAHIYHLASVWRIDEHKKLGLKVQGHSVHGAHKTREDILSMLGFILWIYMFYLTVDKLCKHVGFVPGLKNQITFQLYIIHTSWHKWENCLF